MKILESLRAMKKAGQWKDVIDHIFSEDNIQAFCNIGLSAMSVMLSKAIAQDRDHYDREIARLRSNDRSLEARIDSLEEQLSELEEIQEKSNSRSVTMGDDLASPHWEKTPDGWINGPAGIRIRAQPLPTEEWECPQWTKINSGRICRPSGVIVDIQPDMPGPLPATAEIHYLANIIEAHVSKITQRLQVIEDQLGEITDD